MMKKHESTSEDGTCVKQTCARLRECQIDERVTCDCEIKIKYCIKKSRKCLPKKKVLKSPVDRDHL